MNEIPSFDDKVLEIQREHARIYREILMLKSQREVMLADFNLKIAKMELRVAELEQEAKL